MFDEIWKYIKTYDDGQDWCMRVPLNPTLWKNDDESDFIGSSDFCKKSL